MSTRIYVPQDSTALSVGAEEVANKLSSALGDDAKIIRNGSRGLYWLEPLVEVTTPEGRVAYGPVSVDDIDELVAQGMLDGAQDHPLSLGLIEELPFLKKQQRLTFKRAGIIDPNSLDDYEAHDGYIGLRRAINMTQQECVDEVRWRCFSNGH